MTSFKMTVYLCCSAWSLTQPVKLVPPGCQWGESAFGQQSVPLPLTKIKYFPFYQPGFFNSFLSSKQPDPTLGYKMDNDNEGGAFSPFKLFVWDNSQECRLMMQCLSQTKSSKRILSHLSKRGDSISPEQSSEMEDDYFSKTCKTLMCKDPVCQLQVMYNTRAQSG